LGATAPNLFLFQLSFYFTRILFDSPYFTRIKSIPSTCPMRTMTTATPHCFTAFDGCKRIASGRLETSVLAVKRAAESGSLGPLLIFDDHNGHVLEVDIRGTDEEALARLPKGLAGDAPDALQPRGRGRPKLGVTAREVTLLPRHWDWLSAQPGGASVALRKLVDEARRGSATREEKRRAQERAYQFMSTMAGDLPGFEESTRALFAGAPDKFRELIAGWPADVRDYALHLAFSPEP
jgi:hypothetical protein